MPHPAHTEGPSAKAASRLARWVGWALVVGSFPVWLAVFVTPFLPLSAAQRIAVAGGFVVAGEAMFWTGGAILGASVVARFRKPRVRTGASLAGTSSDSRRRDCGFARPSAHPDARFDDDVPGVRSHDDPIDQVP